MEERRAVESQLSRFGREIRPIWIYAGGLVLLSLVLWLAWPRHRGATSAGQAAATLPSQQPVHQTSAAKQLAPAPVSRKISRVSVSDTSSGATIGEPTTSGEQIWRVIAYAYHGREGAEEMASSINKRHPELAAAVFSPHGHAVVYLVTVGSPMTREEAARYRSRAIAAGMPRDTYIQNYRSE
jgi:hypothetical protein